uniref:Uncharacterized protein n=1 Tax=viral metagenome TaxID=1070528 RepID=A0A6M3L666_9ZZZZ
MIVSAMQTLVSQILTGASTNTKWNATTAVLPALNNAQLEFVHKAIAYSAGSDTIFDELGELQASTSQSVNTTGYDLDGLASSPGPFLYYVASKITIDDTTRWVDRISFKDLDKQNNKYTAGCDEDPKCYIFTNTYFLLLTTGSYPVTATVYYIREPKELVASGASGYQVTTCELKSAFHRLICKMAAAECHRTAGDEYNFKKYESLMNECEIQIQAIAKGTIAQPKGKAK